MTDVIFARQLQHNRHLMWASEGAMPDLGGAENDQYGVWSDPLVEPVVDVPGAYRCVCVELDLYGLTIDAIMCSNLLDMQELNELSMQKRAPVDGDGGGQGGSEDHASAATASFYSYDTACARAFALLKAMVTKWYNDLSFNGDLHADALLLGLYRYLCGHGNALLQDPALHRIVYGTVVVRQSVYLRFVALIRPTYSHSLFVSYGR